MIPTARIRTPIRRKALSLIEVMASVLIMGTMIVSVLTAVTGSVQQVRSAVLQLAASHLARELVTNWNLEKVDMTVDEGGTVKTQPAWSWTRFTQPREPLIGMRVSEITITMIYSSQRNNQPAWQRKFRFWLDQAVETKKGI